MAYLVATLLDIVALLLEAGADLSLARNDGVTPLHIAAQNGHRAICQLLVANPHGTKGMEHERLLFWRVNLIDLSNKRT